MNLLSTKKIISTAAASLLTFGALTFAATPSFASSNLEGGDFMQAFNNTTQEGTWRDPVDAAPGQVVEFRIVFKNTGDQPAVNSQVWGSVTGAVPGGPAKQLVITGRIADNSNGGKELTDTATVNVTGDIPQGLRYEPGHARIQGITSKYNCPNACDIGDNVLGGIDIGDVAPGTFVEVAFKASLTNDVAPSATPSPTPSPTPAPTVAPTPTPGNTIECPAGTTSTVSGSTIVCVQNVNTNTNNNNATGGSATINFTNPTPAPAPVVVASAPAPEVKQLPQTGLPLAAWGLGGLIPVGIKLRKFAGSAKDVITPSFIWEQRNQG